MDSVPRLARVVTVGSDAHMLEEGSRQRERLRSYALLVDQYVALVFAAVPEVAVTTDETLTIIALPKRRLLTAFRFLNTYFAGEAIPLRTATVVSAQDPFELGIIALLLSWRFGWQLHVQVHTAIFTPAFYRESLRSWIQSWIALFVLPRASGIRVVSTPLRDQFVARGYAAERLTVSPVIEPLPAQVRERAYEGGRLELLCVARFVAFKNLDNLIRAFALFAKTRDARLTIVGGGPLEGELRALVAELGLGEHVVLESWVADIAPYYLRSHLFVLASYYEGFGMAIVEALGYGLPVVITHLQGAEEFVTDGENGVIATGYDPVSIAAALARATEHLVTVPPAVLRASLRVPTKEETDALQLSSWCSALL